jgi:penicillin-binding protein 1A
VVKGSLLVNDQTIARKLKEWILAIKMERVFSKDQILELYLNQIPFGGSLYGVEEASQTFFGKHASDLSIPEAAYIAAVFPAPTYYSPYGTHKAALDARKNLVLDKMVEHGYLTPPKGNGQGGDYCVYPA